MPSRSVELVREVLKTHRGFAGLSPTLLNAIAASGVHRSLYRGGHLWRAGEPAQFIGLVVKGMIQIAKPSEDGDVTILGLFGPGDVIGCSAFLRNCAYPADATVAGGEATVIRLYLGTLPSTLGDVDRRELQECLRELLLTHEHVLLEKIEILALRSAHERLFRALNSLAVRFGNRSGEGGSIVIPVTLTKSQMARLTEVRVETAIRILGAWQKQKAIKFARDHVMIDNLENLRELARLARRKN